MVLALLPCAAMAKDTATLNEQLIEAAQRGDLALVKTILAQGADVNGKDEEGATALMVAANAGHLAVVSALLDRGADVDAMSKEGGTALIAACLGRPPWSGGKTSGQGCSCQCRSGKGGGHGADGSCLWGALGGDKRYFWTEVLTSMRKTRRAGQLCGMVPGKVIRKW